MLPPDICRRAPTDLCPFMYVGCFSPGVTLLYPYFPCMYAHTRPLGRRCFECFRVRQCSEELERLGDRVPANAVGRTGVHWRGRHSSQGIFLSLQSDAARLQLWVAKCMHACCLCHPNLCLLFLCPNLQYPNVACIVFNRSSTGSRTVWTVSCCRLRFPFPVRHPQGSGATN